MATPEISVLGPLRQKDSDFKQGMVKMQSLDFATSIDDREREAHLYRLKLLEAQKKQKPQPPMQPMSRMGEDLKKRKEQQALSLETGGDVGGHGLPDHGEKASFGQCSFNMANILMVS